MTKKEAIEFGNMWLDMNQDAKDSDTYQFFVMALKALDLTKLGLLKDCESCKAEQLHDNVISRSVYEQVRWERDIAIAQLADLGYQLGEKIRECDDVISRQEAKDLFLDGTEGYDCHGFTRIEIGDMLDDLQPVYNKHTAKWIYNPNTDLANCSKCGAECAHDKFGRIETNYCHNCGAKMK